MNKKLSVIAVDNNVEIRGTDIDLEKTFTCGQCFRWHEQNGKWFGVVHGRCVVMSQLENGIVIENTSIDEVNSFWIDYLDLNTDYSDLSTYINDKYIIEASEYGKGIHILNQEHLETVISFIISSNNNIKRIEKIIDRFCRLYGKEIEYEGESFFAFPTADELSAVTLESLSAIKAGFRDKYIFDFVSLLRSEPEFLSAVEANTTAKAKNNLMRVKGIGDKVSDCILLFSFGRGEVFPKDVWIKKAVKAIYGEGFDEHIFGKYAGICQQYIYYYARTEGINFD